VRLEKFKATSGLNNNKLFNSIFFVFYFNEQIDKANKSKEKSNIRYIGV